MRKVLVGLCVAFAASAAHATISYHVVPVDNSIGNPTDFDYFTWDLRFVLTGNDDWSMADAYAWIDADEVPFVTWNPRTSDLKPPVVSGQPPPGWDEKFRNMVSSPLDWPNTLDSSASTLFSVASTSDAKLLVTWGDASTVLDVEFTAFRLTLRQMLGMLPLTLAKTGDHVAKVMGRHAAKNTGGTLFLFEFDIYRVPEPRALALLALGGLAGLFRRR